MVLAKLRHSTCSLPVRALRSSSISLRSNRLAKDEAASIFDLVFRASHLEYVLTLARFFRGDPMARVRLFQGTSDIAISRRRVRDFIGDGSDIDLVEATLTPLGRVGLPFDTKRWLVRPDRLETVIEEIAQYISRDDMSITLSA